AAWDTGELAEDPQLQVFGTQLETTEAPPAVPTWEQVAATIDTLVEQASKGATKPEDAVKEMQSKASSIGTGL
nr:ABC transporter substrate-binding protein [Nocardioides sp.]